MSLPDSAIYEEALAFWPYLASWKKVLAIIESSTPKDGALIDLMCGPGHLLGQVQKRRPDLKLTGLDIDQRYIPYAQKKYPGVSFELGDVLAWRPAERFDAVICTGSVHHIPYDRQAEAIEAFARGVKPDGLVIVSDCYIDDYSDEKERKLAAAKLGYEYLVQTIKNGAPEPVVKDTAEIMLNDVMMNEYKTSLKKRRPVFEKYFGEVETSQTWPGSGAEYGDYITICRKPKI